MIFVAFVLVLILAAVRFGAGGEIMAMMQPPYGLFTVHALGVALIVAIAFFADQIVRFFYWERFLRRRRQRQTPALIRDIVTFAFFVIGVSIGLSVEEGFSITGIVTASGATAVVLGFALQAAIQDLFSGLSVHLDRSYTLGDWLTVFTDQVPEPQYGCVTGITWRTTFLELEDGRRLMVPNHVMTANPVLNHSKPEGPKRHAVAVPIDNRIPTERITDMLLGEIFKTLRRPGLARQPEPDVILQKVDADAAHYELRFYFWPGQISPSKAQSIVLEAVLDILQKNEIATPVTQIEMRPSPDFEFILGEEERQGALARAPLFAHALDAAQLEQLSRSCTLREFPRGAVLMRQGDPPSNMYVILEGAVSVAIAGEGGASHEVAISAAGDIVGEMSLMTGAKRNATATAVARLRTLEIEKSDIEALLRTNPGIAERFAQTLARRQQELDAAAHRAARRESQATDILARMKSFFERAFA